MKTVLSKIDIDIWKKERIKEEEITRYMDKDRDFINEEEIFEKLKENRNPDREKVKNILQKSLSIQTLSPDEVATLLNVEDEDLLKEMEDIAGKVKKKVYDNRIVTFAPLYLGNLCVNNCLYCGFRKSNTVIARIHVTIK